MELSKKFIAALTCSTFFLISTAQAEINKSVTYKNQRGSTMTLVWNKTDESVGTVSGTFTSAVGNCKTDVGVPMPVSGIYNGNAVAVTVNFVHCSIVVAMSGNFVGDDLHMLWLDAQQVKDLSGKDWDSNIIGSDHYKKIS